MHEPDWRTQDLLPGVLPEKVAEPDRIVLWVRGERDANGQLWQRFSTAPKPEIIVAEQMLATPATLITARQPRQGLFGKLLGGLRKQTADPTWLLPTGATTVQQGERRTDVILAWPADPTQTIDLAGVKAQWPDSANVQQLGKNMFAIHGVRTASSAAAPAAAATTPAATVSAAALPEGSARAQAEELLAAAQKEGDPRKLALAVTDMGVLQLLEGKVDQAIPTLEQALTLARQTGDAALERDAIGSLANAVIHKNPQRALQLYEQELAMAQAANDVFAQKTALNHLGFFYMRARVPAQAFACFEAALDLARQVNDWQHQAELIWLIAVQHGILGDRQQAEAKAQEAIDLLASMGKPQARVLAEHLAKYRADAAANLGAGAVGGEQFVTGAWTAVPGPSAQPTWLQMGFSAAKSLARYFGSGMKRVSPRSFELRRQICLACEHHTGMRCKLCGCFTALKCWLPREECPAGKWKAE